MKDPIVIDPPNFNQAAAWKDCNDFVEKCGGLAHKDGQPNWRAASGADPGVCSCPACGEYYWAWGNRQRCKQCAFEYPTDWWPMYSWGAQEGQRKMRLGLSWNPSATYRFDERMRHPYYAFGFHHPTGDPWGTCHTLEWREQIKSHFEAARDAKKETGK